jgi:D-3-phosphoglycerate dehydrogenase
MPRVLITSRSFTMPGDYEEEKFCNLLADCDALIIGAHQLTAGALEKAKKLKLVCKHGAGLDNIDLELAKKHQVMVTNVPAMNSNAVADLTMGLMLDLARKVSYAAARVKNKHWEKIIGEDVYGKTLGLVGFGAIAKNVARRAKGFSMKIYAYDPFVKQAPDEFVAVKLTSLEEILRQADFLSIHVPLSQETLNLIAEDQLQQMKKGSYLINTSRGGIVNEAMLYKYLINRHLKGAGLDVTEHEPPFESPLLALDNVTILPHIGMYSVEAIGSVSLVCAQNIVKLFNGEELLNRVV